MVRQGKRQLPFLFYTSFSFIHLALIRKHIHLQRIQLHMSENKTKVSQITAQIIQDLGSDQESTVLKAIQKLRTKGTEQVIPVLFKIFATTKSNAIQEAITKLVHELKVTSAVEPLIRQLSSPQESCRLLALSAIWNSGLNVNEYIDEIIQSATNGSFMEAFEALTIIENLEPPFEEEVILNSQLILNQYFNSTTSSERDGMLKDIAAIINSVSSTI